MLKSLKLLVNLIVAFTTLFVGIAHAGISGFGYTTHYSNADFRDSESRIAINADYTIGVFDLHGQVATNSISPVRRLNVTYPIIFDRNEAGIRIGRFSRVLWFYNDVSDAPSTSRMSVLPQAPYNKKFLTASFATMDGINLFDTYFSESFSLYGELSVGRMEVAEQEKIQPLVIGTHMSNVELTPRVDNWSVFSKLDFRDVSLLVEHSVYKATWKTVGTPDLYSMILTSTEQPWLTIDRVGICIHGELGVVTAEKYWLHTFNNNSGGSEGYYVMFRKPLGDYEGYAGYSSAEAVDGGYAADRFIGVSRSWGKWFASAEYHDLSGAAWSKNGIDDTDSFAVSLAWRF